MPCNGAFRLHRWLSNKESACNAAHAGDVSLIPGLGKKPWGKAWQLLWLENPMETGAWRSTVHRVTKSPDMTEAPEHVCMVLFNLSVSF